MGDKPERVCFVLELRPDRVEDYLAAHETVWPDLLDALREAGWSNYSLFLRPEDGLVIGYLETADFARATEAMASNEVNTRWQRTMAEYFRTPEGVAVDVSMRRLDEYFHLD
ncbi:L-rhamnose mutarotase [Nocardia macrotermitis]|uniref:L-rhamnose mutarotase n=1 Tax=Nocardia macrotermitis TaxID=2585198 RepID=A0A7K0D6E7_9NOCA|nr:L-rhamnose mutarotase [Nocardia macrotermitis]MQY20882.1 L-rhamnose mutarotase [Nocardia macrotermitis]